MFFYVIKEYERENLHIVVSYHVLKSSATNNAMRLKRITKMPHYVINNKTFIELWKSKKLSDPDFVVRTYYNCVD